MKVSKNAYYHWLAMKGAVKGKSQGLFLKERIKAIFRDSKEIYGSHRVQKMLEREGLHYSRSYIALLMQRMGLRSVLRRKHVTTTDSNHSFSTPGNVLDRDFNSVCLGKKWVSDITYIRVNNGWNYLTTIIDLADRKVVGWALSEDMATENTVWRAWLEARRNRCIAPGLIFHSDRGVQYACNKTKGLFRQNKMIVQSMSRKGDCWDNAVAESFFKTIKNEWLYRFRYTSYNELYSSIEEYILWYNTKRIHSSLGYISPLEMETMLRGNSKKAA